MLPPRIDARLVNDLALTGTESVLEIGTGSGYLCALLALRAREVLSFEIHADVAQAAQRHLAQAGIHNAQVRAQDGAMGAPSEGPFDAIVLDPPKFAPTVAHAERAARAYKDINRLALSILEPGGTLFTYSCSGGISADLFHKIVASAGTDAGVDAFITERLGGAPDHPMTVTFPEGEYLKGLVLVRKL
jgi:23S rRNA (cytosine1962-C5)-methyltransferase